MGRKMEKILPVNPEIQGFQKKAKAKQRKKEDEIGDSLFENHENKIDNLRESDRIEQSPRTSRKKYKQKSRKKEKEKKKKEREKSRDKKIKINKDIKIP